MDQFSSNEQATLEKTVEVSKVIKKTKPEDIREQYELETVIDFIRTNEYKTVCLQFPDYMLPDSYEVAAELKRALDRTVYVMADSNYESCCVDYLTAQHVNADAVVHFGPRCWSAWEKTLPCLCIYEKSPMDVEGFVGELRKKFPGGNELYLKTDTAYFYLKEDVEEVLRRNCFNLVDRWKSDGETINVYLGENNRNLLNFQLKERVDSLYYYDPSATEPQLVPYDLNDRILRRRNFLIEKIRDSRRVGIVIATVVLENFSRAVDRVKTLLKLHGKRYYVLSVGKPTVAKLANFPEMDVYVLVCCPSSDVFECRDFHRPIATLHDVETALNGTDGARRANFTYGIDEELLNGEVVVENADAPDVSLISGSIRWNGNDNNEVGGGAEIAVRDKGTVALPDNSGAGFLANRSFRGLEQRFGETEVKLAEKGRKGVAESYENELF